MKEYQILIGMFIGAFLGIIMWYYILSPLPIRKSTDFKMLQYQVEPTCINHVQYYAVGDMDGLHAVTPVFTKEGKTVECNFQIGK
jgi:hypothetical protein